MTDKTSQFGKSKAELRKLYLKKRLEVSENERKIASEKLYNNFFKNVVLKEKYNISAYFPIKNEIDVLPIMCELERLGHKCLLPHMKGKDNPLTFLEWSSDAEMVMGEFNIYEPKTEISAIPDIIIIPLVAFDKNGYRIGYGAGMYDKTIADLTNKGHPVFVIGVGYDFQKTDFIPIEKTDMLMGIIITDDNIYI